MVVVNGGEAGDDDADDGRADEETPRCRGV